MKIPRALRPDEISCRVQQVTESKGAIILLYKDARVDMNILDETYGPMNWKREHHTIDGNLYCTISVWDNDKREWVSKQDVGVESYTEATKGEASDAFKRAGFNWAIGRELYTGPFIFVPLEDGEWQMNPRTNKPQTTFRFGLSVKEIDYTEAREIKSLVLVDKNGRTRFTYGKGKYKPMEVETETPQAVKEPAKVTLTVQPEELAKRKREVAALQKQYSITPEKLKEITSQMGVKKLNEMTEGEYLDFIHALKTKVA